MNLFDATRSFLIAALLFLAGCGGVPEKVVIPEKPVPPPPAGAATTVDGPMATSGTK